MKIPQIKFSLEQFLLWSIKILALLSLTTVWLYSTHFLLGMVVVKHFAFRILVELMFLGYCLLCLYNRRYKPRLSAMTICLVVIFLIYAVSSLINGTFMQSFWGNFVRMDGLLQYGHLLLFFLVLTNIFRTGKEWQWLLQGGLFVAFGVSLVALGQLLGRPVFIESAGGARVTSTFGNAVYFGYYQLIACFVLMWFWLQKNSRDYRLLALLFLIGDILIITYELYLRIRFGQTGPLTAIVGNLYLLAAVAVPQIYLQRFLFQRREYQRHIFFAGVLLLFVIVLYSSGAKAAITAGFLGSAASVLAYIWQRRKVSASSVSLGLIVILAGVLLSWYFAGLYLRKDQPITLGLLVRGFNESQSLIGRSATWRVGLEAWHQKPMIGWGMENFDLAFDHNFTAQMYASDNSPLWYDKAHNVYIQYLVEGGIILSLAYVWLYTLLVWKSIRALRNEKSGFVGPILIGFLAAYIFAAWFYFDTLGNTLFFFLFLAWADALAVKEKPELQPALPLHLPLSSGLLALLLCLATTLFIYNFNFRQLRANWLFTPAIQVAHSSVVGVEQTSIEQIKKIISTTPTLGKDELRSQYAQLVSDYIRAGMSDPYLLRAVESVEINLQKSINKRPGSIIRSVELLNFYLLAGRLDRVYWERGQILSEQLIVENPKMIPVLYLAGRFHILRGDNAQGLGYFQQVIDLVPMVFDAKFNYYKQISSLKPDSEVELYFWQSLSNGWYQDLLPVAAFDLASNRPDRALVRLNQIVHKINSDPLSTGSDQMPEIFRLYAASYWRLKKFPQAMAFAHRAIQADPKLISYFQTYFSPIVGIPSDAR